MADPLPMEQTQFYAPSLWERGWHEALEQASDLEREFVRSHGHLAHLLIGIDGTAVTPERLGWMQLWSLHFTLVEELLAAIRSESSLSLNLLARTHFEALLYVLAIAEPSGGDGGDPEVRDRLLAYTAWCLWQDLSWYDEVLDRRTQRGVWDTSLARELADEFEADPEKRAAFESLFGEVPAIDPVAQSRRRSESGANLSDHRRRVVLWLQHDDLVPWRRKLEEAKQNRSHIHSYFDLIGTARSVPGQLNQHDMRWAYASFSLGSMYAHGTSVDLFLHTGERGVTPRPSTPTSIEKGAAALQSITESVVMLALLKRRLWSG